MVISSSSDPDYDKLISEYAMAVGYLTIYWAALENTLQHTIERLIPTDPLTSKCIGTGMDRASSRASLIQRLVFRPGKSPSVEWSEMMSGLCDQIINSHGKTRNRLVHDDWHLKGGSIQRVNNSVRIGKPGSRQAKSILQNEAAASRVDEINSLSGAVIHISAHLTLQAISYKRWLEKGTPPSIPEQAVRLSKGFPPE